MLYNTSFLRKEFRNAYTQQGFSRKRLFSMGVFLGLLTFALYFSLQTLKESVINDVAPYLLLPSFFSTLNIYLLVSLVSVYKAMGGGWVGEADKLTEPTPRK